MCVKVCVCVCVCVHAHTHTVGCVCEHVWVEQGGMCVSIHVC